MLVVLDADCIIAGTLASAGACREILDLWLTGAFEAAVCPQLLGEVERALLNPRIASRYNVDPVDARAWVQRLCNDGCAYRDPVSPRRVVPDDPKDDYLVALAVTADAAALVSRDQHFDKVDRDTLKFDILKPSEFRRLLRGA